MDIKSQKLKVIGNNTDVFVPDIRVNGTRLETVEYFKCLGSVISDQGSKPEILRRRGCLDKLQQ